jgi:hypothetical protein
MFDFFRRALYLLRVRQNSAFMVMMDQHIEELKSRYLSDERRLEPYGYKVYSQGDEDGILAEIFRRIGVTDRRFIEFGCGDGLENNTSYLALQGWQGLWIDSLEHNESAIRKRWAEALASGQLTLQRAFITATNINDLISANGFSGEIDLLSVDIDSNDYHVWEAISVVQPRVVCVEYNAKYPPPFRWVMPRDDSYVWDGTDRMGASLSALADLGERKGLALVGCDIIGTNAFFVRHDLAVGKFAEPFTPENHYHPPRYYLTFGFFSGHSASSQFSGNSAPGLQARGSATRPAQAGASVQAPRRGRAA